MRIEANTFKKTREEGKAEAMQAVAKTMLVKHKPLNEIVEFTDLSKEQIEKLK
ncbi:MAG: hypothetical protein LBH67_02955 [Rickettsia sp.]|jgi:hypothetical protein|nr:hypothetical protein [Rickettsia sp.]